MQLVPISGIGTSNDISADDYLNIVRPQSELQAANIKTIASEDNFLMRDSIRTCYSLGFTAFGRSVLGAFEFILREGLSSSAKHA